MWCLILGACVCEFAANYPFIIYSFRSDVSRGLCLAFLGGIAVVCCMTAVLITRGVERIVSAVFLLMIFALVISGIDDVVEAFIH